MKKYSTLLTALMVMAFSIDCFASADTSIADKLTKRYLVGLNHSNEGVVESAIINVMKLKFYYPDADYSKIIGKLNQLTAEGSTKRMRIRSYVVNSYLEHPERFNWFHPSTEDETKVLVTLMTEKLDSYAK